MEEEGVRAMAWPIPAPYSPSNPPPMEEIQLQRLPGMT